MQCKKCRKPIPDDARYCQHCGADQNPAKPRRARGNGMGTAYKMPNGKWRADVVLRYDEDGRAIRRTKSGFERKRDALEYIPTLKGQIERPSVISLYELYATWSKTHYKTLSKSHEYAYKKAYERIEPIRHANIANLRLDDLQKVVDGNTYYPARDIKQVLSHLYKLAIVDGYITRDLSAYIKLPPATKSDKVPFTADEKAALWAEFERGTVECGYALAMIYTGMRPGELLNVRKDRIDYAAKQIMDAGIKTDQGISVPISFPARLTPVFKALGMASDTDCIVPYASNKFYEVYYAALERAKCRPLPPGCGRHTCATDLALAGVAPATIQAVMRHTKYSTTLGYTHINTAPQIAALEKLFAAE